MVTLQYLYDLVKDKTEMRLVAGEPGLNHVVTWLHMVEGTDISSFLEGNEIAFTTGIALKDEDELFELVKDSHRMKAAGMVINIGPFIKEIPQNVIDYANENAFPVFEVPWRVHMSNIMRDFTAEIHMDKMRSMELEVAFKNAFYSGDAKELYLPTLQKNGFKKEWSYTMALMEFFQEKGELLEGESYERILHYGSDFLKVLGKDDFIMDMDGKIAIVFCNKSEETVKQALQQFLENLRTYGLKFAYSYAGVGKQVMGIHHAGRCFSQADQVLRLQRKRDKRDQVLTYGEMGLYKLIFPLEGQALLKEYYRETLGEMERYDAIKGTDYCDFLKEYLVLEGNAQEVAAKLHLHRNSVSYKIHKIEEILGVSLGDRMEQTKIIMAFMIKELN